MLETSIPDEELREKFPGLIEYRAWLRANGARVYWPAPGLDDTRLS
jgi:hypothetical protein